jgi:hypothetical protein
MLKNDYSYCCKNLTKLTIEENDAFYEKLINYTKEVDKLKTDGYTNIKKEYLIEMKKHGLSLENLEIKNKECNDLVEETLKQTKIYFGEEYLEVFNEILITPDKIKDILFKFILNKY